MSCFVVYLKSKTTISLYQVESDTSFNQTYINRKKRLWIKWMLVIFAMTIKKNFSYHDRFKTNLNTLLCIHYIIFKILTFCMFVVKPYPTNCDSDWSNGVVYYGHFTPYEMPGTRNYSFHAWNVVIDGCFQYLLFLIQLKSACI